MNKRNNKENKFESILKKIAVGLTVLIIVLAGLGMSEIIDLLTAIRIGVCLLSLVIAINGYNLFPRNRFSAVLLYGCSALLIGWLIVGISI